MWILGKQAIDADNGQTAQMLATLWQRPHASYVSKLEFTGRTARATREIDAGLETIDFDLPGVVSTDLRLNEPRFVKLPEILKAKRKPIARLSAEELGVEVRQRISQLQIDEPPPRSAGTRVDSVDELLAALRERGAL